MVIQKYLNYVIKTWHVTKWLIFSTGVFNRKKEKEFGFRKKRAPPLLWSFFKNPGGNKNIRDFLTFCQLYHDMILWYNWEKKMWHDIKICFSKWSITLWFILFYLRSSLFWGHLHFRESLVVNNNSKYYNMSPPEYDADIFFWKNS